MGAPGNYVGKMRAKANLESGMEMKITNLI